MIHKLAKYIENYKVKERIVVLVDGIDTSGKTTYANQLAELIENRQVIRVSIDDFHNPKEIRIRQGEYSPEGYYHDSFNYNAIKENVLIPFKKNNQMATKGYDYKIDQVVHAIQKIESNAILIFDGVFLHRGITYQYKDLSVFLDINFEEAINRGVRRDLSYFGSKAQVISKYQRRYLPGQRMYMVEEDPKGKADFVIDNNNYHQQILIKAPKDF